MIYKLIFTAKAQKEWRKLDNSIRAQLARKLEERRENPRVPADRLRHSKDRYKIKLRELGYRLVYEVHDDEIVLLVVGIGRRDGMEVYEAASRR